MIRSGLCGFFLSSVAFLAIVLIAAAMHLLHRNRDRHANKDGAEHAP